MCFYLELDFVSSHSEVCWGNTKGTRQFLRSARIACFVVAAGEVSRDVLPSATSWACSQCTWTIVKRMRIWLLLFVQCSVTKAPVGTVVATLQVYFASAAPNFGTFNCGQIVNKFAATQFWQCVFCYWSKYSLSMLMWILPDFYSQVCTCQCSHYSIIPSRFIEK